MANLPVLDDMRPTPNPAGRASIDMPRDGGYDALGQGFSSLSRSLAKVKLEDDRLRTEDAFNKLQQRRLELTSGEGGYLSKRSRQVVEESVYKDYMDQFNAAADDIGAGLTNDNQKQMFSQRADIARLQYGSDLTTHIQSQKEAYNNQVFEGGIKVESDTAAANWGSPNVVATSIERTRRLIDQQANRQGWAEDARAAAKISATSSIHTSVIDNMLATNNDLAAQAYYDQVKTEIAGEAVSAIEQALEAGSLRGQSQRLSDNLLSRGLSEREALAEARGLDDPKLRDEVTRRIRDRYEEDRYLSNQEQQQAHQAALEIVEKTGSLDNVPAPLLMGMSIGERNAIEERSRQVRMGIEPVTDEQKYYDLQTMAAMPETRNLFRDRDLLQDRPFLNNSAYNDLKQLQMQLRMSDGKADKKIAEFQTQKEIVGEALDSIGIDKKKRPEYHALFGARINEEQARIGRALDNEEMRNFVDKLLMKGEIKSGKFYLPDRDVRFHQIEKTDKEERFAPDEVTDIDDVPMAEKYKIADYLGRKDRPVSDENVLELYNRKIKSRYE